MPKRNRAICLVAMPLATILFVLGWIFYWFGSRRQMEVKIKQKSNSEFNFLVSIPELKNFSD
jgi:hypothetical protein